MTSPQQDMGKSATSPLFLSVTSQRLFALPTLIAVNRIKFVHSVYTSSIRFEHVSRGSFGEVSVMEFGLYVTEGLTTVAL